MSSLSPIPLGYCVSEVRRKNLGRQEQNLLSLSYGRIVRKDIESVEGLLPESFDSYNIVEPGDTVLRLTDLQNDQRSLRVGLVAERGIITSAYVTVRPTARVNERFLNYFLKMMDFRKDFYALGAGVRQSLKFDELRRVQVSVPDPASQRVIADYLDTETARIDALIDKKQRMIALLDERLIAAKWALLTSACQHPVRVKAVVTKVGSGSTPRGGTDVYVDEGVAFLRSQNIRDGRVRLDDVVFISESDDGAMSGTRVRAGDVLLNITGGSIGRTAVVKEANLPANVSQHVCIVRPAAGVDPTVLQAALDTDSVQQQISLLQVGGNREGLNFEQVRGLQVRVPSEGAASLAVRLKSAESAHRQALDRLALQIDLLRERRQALITAAVTGELEIPGVAA